MIKEKQKKCSECLTILPGISPIYYCCDPSEKFCKNCRKKACSLCESFRDKKHTTEICQKCKQRNTIEDLFLDYKCGSYYCDRCLRVAFDSGKSISSNVYMPRCRDAHPKNQVLHYLQNFCSKCQKRLNIQKSRKVKENQYICSGCDKKKKIEILQCSACNEKIFDEKKIGKKEDGLILCTLCMRGSIIEQQFREEKKQNSSQENKLCLTDEEYKMVMAQKENNYQKEKKEKKEQKDNQEVKEDKQMQIINQKSQIAIQKQPRIVEQMSEQKYSVIKIEKKPKKRQLSEKKSEKFKQEEMMIEEKDFQKRNLLRNNSGDLLQNVHVKIEKQNPEDIIVCSICSYQLEGIFSISGTETENIICRGCFTLQIKKNFGFSSRIDEQRQNKRERPLTLSKIMPKQKENPSYLKKNEYLFANYGMPQTNKLSKLINPNKIKPNPLEASKKKCIKCQQFMINSNESICYLCKRKRISYM